MAHLLLTQNYLYLGTTHYLLYRGGLRRNWGAFKFFTENLKGGALKKYRESKEGGL
jgi:hypothetical protein